MAKKITTLDNFNPITTQFPAGSLKDRVYIEGEDDESGSRIYASYMQDVLNVFHRTGREFGKFLNGAADTQLVSQFFDWTAAAMLHKGSNFYTATSETVNVYELTRGEGPIVYVRGLTARFVVPFDNTAETATVNLFGIGALPMSDRFLEIGATPTLPVGFLKAGDVVEVMFDISEDAVQYFRVMGTPMNQLTEGVANIQRTVGSTVDVLRIFTDSIALTEQVISGVLGTKTMSLEAALVSLLKTDTATTRNVVLRMDADDEYFKASRSGGSQDYLDIRSNFKGVSFAGGPNSGTTEDVFSRFTRVEVATNQVEFVASTSRPGNWEAFEYGSPTVPFVLNLDIPAGAEILFAYAKYYTSALSGSHRTAPIFLQDISLTTETSNSVKLTIMSGDSGSTASEPDPNDTNGYLHLHIWYNGASL